MRRFYPIICLSILFFVAVSYLPILAQSLSPFDLVNLKNQGLGDITAYEKIKITDAWNKINDLRPPLSSVVVGIFDTGIDIFHPEFSQVNIDTSITTDTKERGHGTQISGIIGANNLSFSGQYTPEQMNGILSGVRDLNYTLDIKFSGELASSTDNFRHFLILDQLSRSFRSVQIINNSWGAPLCSKLSDSQKLLLNRLCYGQEEFNRWKGILSDLLNQYPSTLFVFAAGNDGIDAQFNLPGGGISANNLITVGATDSDDKRAAPFPLTLGLEESNFGSSVNISAPGVNVYAPKPGGEYDKNFSGTSASAPMVMGVAGLIKAIKPDLTPAQIKDILVRNADPIQTDKPIGGRLNALKAVCDPLVGLNCAPAPPPQPSNTWQSVGSMTTERADHTATLLNDGRILITGGFRGAGNSFTTLASAEIFNPNDNTFTSVGNMTTSRTFHTATLLNDGRVLIAGGTDNSGLALNSAEIFNPATNVFSPVGNLNSKRFFHTSDLLSDGKVLIAGGNNVALKSTEIFDPNTNVFTPGPDMTVPRSHAASTFLNDGRVLIVNGLLSGTLMSVDIYNPVSNTFTSATSSVEQLGLSVNTLPNGKVSILGSKLFNQTNGQAAEIFNPTDNSFVEIGPMLIAGIARDSAVLLNSGQVLFVGASIKAQIFNSQTNEFKLTGDLNTPRFIRHRLTLLQDGRALVTGGQLSEISFITTNGAEVYKP